MPLFSPLISHIMYFKKERRINERNDRAREGDREKMLPKNSRYLHSVFSSVQFELHVYILYSNLFRLFATFFLFCLCRLILFSLLFFSFYFPLSLLLPLSFFLWFAFILLLLKISNVLFCTSTFNKYITPFVYTHCSALIVEIKRREKLFIRFSSTSMRVCVCLLACLFLFSSCSILNKFRILCSLHFAPLFFSLQYFAVCWCW